jgi:hypothetical protein
MAWRKAVAWKGGINPELRGDILEGKTGEFEASSDGLSDKCNEGRREG